jgi:hypothetical protein
MKKFVLVGACLLALAAAAPAHAEDGDDWGWHMWGWGGGPGRHMWDNDDAPWGMMMGRGMMGGGMMGPMAMLDANGDGLIGADEAAAHAEFAFAAMDDDGDGTIAADEMGRGPRGWGRSRNEERRKAMEERHKAHFAAMDADKDGKVTQAEFFAGAKARYEAADADKDGKVTPWEFRAQRWQ